MIGANWQSDPQHVYKKKFAWLPITTNSKKRVWLEDYYVRYTHYDANGSLLSTEEVGNTHTQKMNY